MQVSPSEIESVLLGHPGGLVDDVAVAGVQPSSTRKSQQKEELSERVPRAWVVPTAKGKALGEEHIVRELNEWLGSRLSRYKQLTGGIGFVSEVSPARY